MSIFKDFKIDPAAVKSHFSDKRASIIVSQFPPPCVKIRRFLTLILIQISNPLKKDN